ncbi:MAG: hypothetical protein WAU89_23280 [Candidatus Acidiferrales bacterium]
MTLGDPLKLIPLIGAVGVMVLVGIGKVDTNQAIMLLTAIVGVHSTISALNNSNPK